MNTRCQITLVAAVVAAVTLVAGCVVGPPYIKPDVDTPSAFKEGSPAAYAYAGEIMTRNMLAQDAAEGIDAFIQKREPVWRDA